MPPTRRAKAAAAPVAEENEYEAQRAAKIAENAALLRELELERPDASKSQVLIAKKSSSSTKRRAVPTAPTRSSSRLRSRPETSFQQLSDLDSDDDLPRRKKPRNKAAGPLETPPSSGEDDDEDAEKQNWRRQPKGNGRVHGHIPGVPVGSWWEMRIHCGHVGVHPPTVAGIFGGAHGEGAYSVAVSAGYPEDVDEGDRFTYTGSGGRELKKKNLRTAPQSSDQKLERGNKALYDSAQTGNPVRVIRGFKARMGPVKGYRYDGLYKVVRAYEANNVEGRYKVWKFDFERLPGQPPVDYEEKENWLVAQEREHALRDAEEAATAKEEAEEEGSTPGANSMEE